MRLLTKYFQGIAHDLKGVNQNYNVKFAAENISKNPSLKNRF